RHARRAGGDRGPARAMTVTPPQAGPDQWSALSFTLRGPRISGLVASPSVDAAYFQTQVFDGSFRVTRLNRVGGGEVPVPPELGCYAHALLADGTLVLLGRDGRAGATGTTVATLDPASGTVTEVWRCPGSVLSVTAAARARVAVLKVKVMRDAADLADDVRLRVSRRAAGTSAILHEGPRIHQHDLDLGPDEPRLVLLDLRGEPAATDLTPWAGRGLRDQAYAVSPDGRHVAVIVLREWPGPVFAHDLVLVDTATGAHRTLAAEPGVDFLEPAFSPDAPEVVCVVAERSTARSPARHRLTVVDVATGARTDLPNDAELIPGQVRVDPNGRILFVADQDGHRKLFSAGRDGEPRALTRTGAVVRHEVTGRGVLAILSTPVSPPRVIRLGARVRVLHEETPEGAGTNLHRVGREVDGVRLGAWLALPGDAAGPLPLAVFLHGGPIASWTGWLWGWNPTVLTDQGWAVLLPDPALSSGYGQAHLDRGWGAWDRAPVTDTLALLDAALAEFPALDPARVAAAGGSFGGYLALRLLRRHRDRFRCGVVQAAPFDLPSFVASSDAGHYFRRELSDVDGERTGDLADLPPVLLVHGARDRRVPVSQALHLWQELNADALAGERGHQFLYFPDEGHSIRRPGNLETWYRTLRRFLDRHVRQLPGDDLPWV
ncbi:S9 family peptidase, partial [Actinophytocola sp.]|uniref:S9 family peptidase n=1 Tax=Actinophytocola sp. TaxID=1872138 RepID=UPI003D6A94C5